VALARHRRRAVPCLHTPYIGLATILSDLPGNDALQEGVSELGFRLLSFDEEALEELELMPPGSAVKEIPGWDDLSKPSRSGPSSTPSAIIATSSPWK